MEIGVGELFGPRRKSRRRRATGRTGGKKWVSCSVQCAMSNEEPQSAVFSVQCAVCSVRSAVSSV